MKEDNLLDKWVVEVEMDWKMEMTPAGVCLYILNPSAECSLNDGFRYIRSC